MNNALHRVSEGRFYRSYLVLEFSPLLLYLSELFLIINMVMDMEATAQT